VDKNSAVQAVFSAPSARTSSIATPLTVGENQALSKTTNNRGHDDLEAVVEITRRRTPQESQSDGRDFVELNHDAIDVATLRALQAFVAKARRQRQGRGEDASSGMLGIPPEKLKENADDRGALGPAAYAEFSTAQS